MNTGDKTMQHQIHGVQIGKDWYYLTENDDEDLL